MDKVIAQEVFIITAVDFLDYDYKGEGPSYL